MTATQSSCQPTHVHASSTAHAQHYVASLTIVLVNLTFLRGKSSALLTGFVARPRAQKMSHLTSRPFADLIKLATSLEEMAFTKAAGSQVGSLHSPVCSSHLGYV